MPANIIPAIIAMRWTDSRRGDALQRRQVLEPILFRIKLHVAGISAPLDCSVSPFAISAFASRRMHCVMGRC